MKSQNLNKIIQLTTIISKDELFDFIDDMSIETINDTLYIETNSIYLNKILEKKLIDFSIVDDYIISDERYIKISIDLNQLKID